MVARADDRMGWQIRPHVAEVARRRWPVSAAEMVTGPCSASSRRRQARRSSDGCACQRRSRSPEERSHRHTSKASSKRASSAQRRPTHPRLTELSTEHEHVRGAAYYDTENSNDPTKRFRSSST